MKKITVSATKEYDVLVGEGLLCKIGSYTASLSSAGKVAVISDSNVWPIYGEIVTSSLVDSGFSVYRYVLEAGEESKNGNSFLSILNFLAENQLSRNDCIIALGGGVVGDITGFSAATYLRGVKYIQVPTSLLAMVDSSVGGKTAIDLPAGKNLAGAFYQPNLVVCDLNVLNTLPETIFNDGCSEVIKYGILFDADLFDHLSRCATSFDRSYVISRCIELKRDIVERDEFERGPRKLLNLGHTIGHAIEKLSNYKISHGSAVSTGIAIVAQIAKANYICSAYTANKILQILTDFSLPIKTNYSAYNLFTVALSDKKASGDSIALILPQQVGKCVIQDVPISELESMIRLGL